MARAAALLERRHDLVPVDLTGLLSVLVESPIRLSSMGRGVHDDPGYFLAAAAAGRHAAGLLSAYCAVWVKSMSTTITRVSFGATEGVGLPSG